MAERARRPLGAAVVGPHVVVTLQAAAKWKWVLAKAIGEAERKHDRIEPEVRDVFDAFVAAAAFVDESKRAKGSPNLSLSAHSHSAPQVAELAGVSEQAVRLAAREGRLPGRRVGRAWNFEREDVERWIEARSA